MNQSLLARLEQLERAVVVLADAQKSVVQSTVQSVQDVGKQALSASAVRIRDGLARASHLFPKTKTIVFAGRECGGDGRFEYFGDNIKYAYLSFCQAAQHEGVSCTFLTDSEKLHGQLTRAGLPCLPWFVPDWRAEHVRLLLSAKIKVLCNIFYPVDERGYLSHALLDGARSVQLWHGIPFKQIGMEHLTPPADYGPRQAEVLGASGPFDLFVASSRTQRSDWSNRFIFHDYAPVGSPRTDVLFREPTAFDRINIDEVVYQRAEEACRIGRGVVFYAPTFRDGAFGVWFQNSQIEAVAAFCADRGSLFCVNLHPLEAGFVEGYRKAYPSILFIEPLTDIQPLLSHVDVLITDYSSLAFDFLLCDRPILFYRPDHQSYVTQSRPLIQDHESYLCGPVLSDAPSLCRAVGDALAGASSPDSDRYRDMRARVRRRLYDEVTGGSCDRLNAVLLQQLAV